MQLYELKKTWHERSNTVVSENVNINISCYLKILSIWTSFRNVRYKFSSGKYPVFRTMFGPSGCALGRKTVLERKKLCADWLICSHVHTIREVCCDWLTRFASITQCRAVWFVSMCMEFIANSVQRGVSCDESFWMKQPYLTLPLLKTISLFTSQA